MSLHEQILRFMDEFIPPLHLYEAFHLKTNLTIELISNIIKDSNKQVSEAVLVFLAVLRYLTENKNTGPLQEFIKENSHLICKMAIEKRGQCNLPGRALPLFEIFEKKIRASSISVIELGASYGVLGRCLLNPGELKKRKDLYFPPKQQMPEIQTQQTINYYLGIEMDPPDERWILAWPWDENRKQYLRNFLRDIHAREKFKMLKGDVFGFSKLRAVKEISANPSALVVLTSFLLYQFGNSKQNQLKNEISGFTGGVNRCWINQDIDVSSMKCFIEFNGEKIIELSDDTCRSWKWSN